MCKSSQPKIQTFIAEETDEKRIGTYRVANANPSGHAPANARMKANAAWPSPILEPERLLQLNDEINSALNAYRDVQRGAPRGNGTPSATPARSSANPNRETATPQRFVTPRSGGSASGPSTPSPAPPVLP